MIRASESSAPVISTRALMIVAFFAALGSACDEDGLSRALDPLDSGVRRHPDAEEPPPPPPPPPPDAGVRRDAAAPDAEPPATEPVYIHTGDTLYSYDPVTNRAATIGRFRTSDGTVLDMVDIAIDLRGRMFGGTIERELFRVDPSTGLCTYLSTYDDILHGLTFISDGRLVVAGLRVSIVDPNNGRTIMELVGEGEYQTSGDIVGLPDGMLYWSVRGGQGEGDGLVQIDPADGSTRYLGQGSVGGLFGLGFAYDVLYGFSRDGVAVTIDQANGRVMEEKPLTGRWYGATTNPVLW